MEIRRATLEELPRLVALQREVQELDVAADPTLFRKATDDELLKSTQEFLTAGQNVIWIAWVERVPAGFLAFKVETAPENAFFRARNDGIIDDLAVAARFRRQGIGRALVAHAEQYAISQGCTDLRLFVLAGNTAGRGFYDALNFAPTFSAGERSCKRCGMSRHENGRDASSAPARPAASVERRDRPGRWSARQKPLRGGPILASFPGSSRPDTRLPRPGDPC